jgi:hypothetical protein
VRRHEIALLACRLLAIYLILSGAGEALSMGISLVSSLIGMESGSHFANLAEIMGIVAMSCIPLGQAVVGAMLWIFSPSLAKRMIDDDGVRVTSTANPQSILGVALPIIGILTGLQTVRNLVIDLYSTIRAKMPEPVNIGRLASNLIVLGVCGWLIVGSNAISQFIVRLRSPNFSSPDPAPKM